MKQLTCTKCGTPKKATTKRYNKMIEAAGGEDKLKESYVCRSCRDKKK